MRSWPSQRLWPANYHTAAVVDTNDPAGERTHVAPASQDLSADSSSVIDRARSITQCQATHEGRHSLVLSPIDTAPSCGRQDLMNEQRPEHPPLRLSTLLAVSAIGAVSALLAYVIGRGNIPAMIAVFAVIAVGQRVWSLWYRKRHGVPL